MQSSKYLMIYVHLLRTHHTCVRRIHREGDGVLCVVLLSSRVRMSAKKRHKKSSLKVQNLQKIKSQTKKSCKWFWKFYKKKKWQNHPLHVLSNLNVLCILFCRPGKPWKAFPAVTSIQPPGRFRNHCPWRCRGIFPHSTGGASKRCGGWRRGNQGESWCKGDWTSKLHNAPQVESDSKCRAVCSFTEADVIIRVLLCFIVYSLINHTVIWNTISLI